MMPRCFAVAAIAMALALTLPAAADYVRLTGSDIALRQCTVSDVRSGRVYFQTARGRRDWRELTDVAALGFDDLPLLDAAEKQLVAGESDRGVRTLLRALLVAPKDSVASRWIRVRLVREHARRGETVPAISHLIALVESTADPGWVVLESVLPAATTTASPPTVRQAAEAQRRLASTKRTIEERPLQSLLGRLETTLDALCAGTNTDDVDHRSTESGLLLREIRDGADADTAGTTDPGGAGAAGGSGSAAQSGAPSSGGGKEIDRMLEREAFEEAVAACEKALADPGERELAKLLQQHGAALRGIGRHRTAALSYMRLALLVPDDPRSVDGYLESARIYRDVLGRRDVALRLARRGLDHARGLTNTDAVRRAQALVDSFGDTK